MKSFHALFSVRIALSEIVIAYSLHDFSNISNKALLKLKEVNLLHSMFTL